MASKAQDHWLSLLCDFLPALSFSFTALMSGILLLFNVYGHLDAAVDLVTYLVEPAEVLL
jgi:hypothetical protein